MTPFQTKDNIYYTYIYVYVYIKHETNLNIS